MKTTFYIFLLALCGLAISCDDDDVDDVVPPETSETAIMGTWNLVNISGGFAGIDADIASGTITWTFDEEASMLHVVNNYSGEEAVYDGYETGNYSYSIIQVDGNEQLNIDGGAFGNYTIAGDEMVIVQNNGSDGYVMTFQR